MNAGAFTRQLAPRLSGAMLERVKDGAGDAGWLHDAVRAELRRAHAAGLDGVDAITATCAALLAAQAREVFLTLEGYAAKLDVAAVAVGLRPEEEGAPHATPPPG